MEVIVHIKKNKVMYSIGVLCLVIGALLTLSIENIRYTKYVPPKTVEMDPREAYEEILKDPENSIFFDVRTAGEYNNLHASTSVSMPIANLYDNWRTLPRSGKTIYLICTTGRLAGVAYGYLQLHGFTNIVHVTGGINQWIDEGLPTVAKQLFLDKDFMLDIPVNINGTKGSK